MALDVTLDEIVKSLLIQQGENTEHKYMQYLDIAIRGLKELSFDILQQIKILSKKKMRTTLTCRWRSR